MPKQKTVENTIDEKSRGQNIRHSLQVPPTQILPDQDILRPTQSQRNLSKKRNTSYVPPATIPESEDDDTLQIVSERTQITFMKRNEANRGSKVSTASGMSLASSRRESVTSGYDNPAFEGNLSKSRESIAVSSVGPSTRDPSVNSLT